jgi:hypothetical protein
MAPKATDLRSALGSADAAVQRVEGEDGGFCVPHGLVKPARFHQGGC